MLCSLSKVAYRAGDKAFVNVEITNNSAVEIRNFVLKVRTTIVHKYSSMHMINFLTGNKSNKAGRKG